MADGTYTSNSDGTVTTPYGTYFTNLGGIDYYGTAAAGQQLVTDVTNPNSPLYTSDVPFQQSLTNSQVSPNSIGSIITNPATGSIGTVLLVGLLGVAALIFSQPNGGRKR
jgi:hypothetical protein